MHEKMITNSENNPIVPPIIHLLNFVELAVGLSDGRSILNGSTVCFSLGQLQRSFLKSHCVMLCCAVGLGLRQRRHFLSIFREVAWLCACFGKLHWHWLPRPIH